MIKQSIDLLVSEYLSGDISKDEFIKIYDRCTEDYSFLVINNNSVKDFFGKVKIYKGTENWSLCA